MFARGELRSGRVLGLPKLIADAGDGESEGEGEGEGSAGVGCWRGVCNDRDSLDGDPGGVVVRTCSGVIDDGSVGCTLIEGLSAFGVLEGERDAGSGTFVGSTSLSLGGISFSACPVPSSPPWSSSPSPPSFFSSSPSSSSI